MDERPSSDAQRQQADAGAAGGPEPVAEAAAHVGAPWWRQPGPAIIAGAVVIAVGVGTGIALAGSGSGSLASAPPSPSPSTIEVAGTITIPFGLTLDPTARDTSVAPGENPHPYDVCVAEGGYTDISAGTAVTIGGPAGQTLGIGSLGPGRVTSNDANNAECQFGFSVPVAGGQSLYTVTISHRGTQTFTPDQVAQGVQLTLGAQWAR